MGKQSFRSDCTRKLSQLKPHSTFLTIHNYTNVESGKIADWSIIFHISYLNALRRSIQMLQQYEIKSTQCIDKPFSYQTLKLAREELLTSWELSLEGKNYSASAQAYDEVEMEDVNDAFGKAIPGVKLHRKQDLLHLYGFVVHSRIISPGVEKIVDHSSLTLAKKFLRNKWSFLGRWVQYRLEPGRFDKIVVSNMTIKDHEAIREAFK